MFTTSCDMTGLAADVRKLSLSDSDAAAGFEVSSPSLQRRESYDVLKLGRVRSN